MCSYRRCKLLWYFGNLGKRRIPVPNSAAHIKFNGLPNEAVAENFVLDRYSQSSFQGIIPDTGAAKSSTGGLEQFLALQRDIPSLKLDKAWDGNVSVRFGVEGPLNAIGVGLVTTPTGKIHFQIIPSLSPFLIFLQDMDNIGVYLNNITNAFVTKEGNYVPIIRKWGHP